MAATVTALDTRRSGTGTVGGPTVRAAIDAFLDSPKVTSNRHTLRAYTNVLDRAAELLGPNRRLADVADDELATTLSQLWGTAKPATWNRNRAAVGSWLTWCATRQHWTAPAVPAAAERRRENNDDTKAVSRSRIDRLCRRRNVPLREKTLWRMLYESASRASAVLALNIEDLDLANKQARITVKGGDTMWITWGTDTAHLLPRLIAGREHGPLFLSEHRPGPHRRATTDTRDICPETGRARLGYDRARILLGHHGDGLRLHQLRHSSATHLGDANVSANVIMTKTGHKSLRSVQRYVKPGLAAVHEATETLSGPRRRG
ncbi:MULTISPECIES: tyrosine-type recombinase/integrase [Actinoalloteichus]|uniref:Site-specific recombinase XerD n=1 Tax=Actinoalloteichus fjordicus TaxID=1612552 RepID=A0AAC9PSJ8_9PSEU|nr:MULTISPECIES: site-specific integrase [Actinoalloteichus]APU15082.1 site-specific recombinase XerD [Actinoalloteichus fjordicus]APU21151.1 site-specific recombinase XerD [Actinoalloteichus sp. GBA129-24]